MKRLLLSAVRSDRIKVVAGFDIYSELTRTGDRDKIANLRPQGVLISGVCRDEGNKVFILESFLKVAMSVVLFFPILVIAEEHQATSRAEELRHRRLQKAQQSRSHESNTLERALLYVESRAFQSSLSLRWKDFYPKFGNLSHGSGQAPGVRYFKSNLGGSALSVESSGAFSFNGYKLGHSAFGRFNRIAPYTLLGPGDFVAPFELGRERPEQNQFFLYGDARYRYFPEENFSGLGSDSKEDNETSFLLEDGSYDLVAGYQSNRWLGLAVRAGYLQTNTGGGADGGDPSIETLFDDNSAPGLARQPSFFHLNSAIYFDYRDVPSNPHSGGVISFSFSRFDEWQGSEFDFNRFMFDTRQFVPLGSRQRVLALHFFVSTSDSGAAGRVPFYLMDTLGGAQTLRGFSEFRFRDSDMLYLSAEYRWEAAPAVEFALFYDAGKVFPEADDFNFRRLRKSYGGGIRFKGMRRVLVRLDIGHSVEGTRVHFRFGPSF